jgi:rod shape-determining protein MreC
VATRSRSARAAVLASSVQRSKSTPYPSKARSTLIRRAVVAVLVFVALVLVTISFRSPTAGALHGLQGAGSTALRPFQIAATRVAQPFRDGYSYVHGLASAKSELKREKRLYLQVRQEAIANRAAAVQARQLERILHFERGQAFPRDYRPVNAAVISPPGGPFAHTLAIEAGSSSGVRLDSPVVSGDGLVGIVTNVFPDTATVTLLSDPNSFVAALDLHTQVRGMIHTGPSGTLILDQVQKSLRVKKGDELVTTGTHNARYPDLYPYGIPIGRVTNVGAADTAVFLQVQVQPFANLGSLDAVAVLVPKKPRR